MSALDKRGNNNNVDLADQSLSSESIAHEIQSPALISSDNRANNNNNDNTQQILAQNNSEEQQLANQANQDQLQEQLIEEEQQPTQNSFIRCMKSIGSTIYTAMYNAGGFLADLFGITTPRYAYAIHEYEKHQERVRRRQLELEEEANGENTNDVEQPLNSLEPDQAL